MTTKDYDKIAKAIGEATTDLIIYDNDEVVATIVDALANIFESDKKFDRTGFYNLCGIIPTESVDENAIS
jgi:hypothetical protein